MKTRDLLIASAVCAFGTGLVLWPGAVIEAGRESLTLCANVIFPSLFPFFVLSSLVVGLGYADRLGALLGNVMPFLFGLSGPCATALVLGLVGGYPVGAKTAAQLYQTGLCSKAEAQRMLGFCNNAGPAFLLGVVGVGVFGSVRLGLMLWVIHIISALLVGLLLRLHGGNLSSGVHSSTHRQTVFLAQVFTDAVKGSLTALLNVCAFIFLFGVLLRLGQCAGLLTQGSVWLQRFLCGFVELSNGVAMLPADAPHRALPLAAFFLGWGGLSVLCQTMSVIQEAGLSIKTCIWGKLLHGILSAGLCSVLLRLFPATASAWANSITSVPKDYVNLFSTHLLCAAALALLALVGFCCLGKKWGGNRRSKRL